MGNVMYLCFVVLGLLLSHVVQHIDFPTLLRWMGDTFRKKPNQTSLALLTILDHKQKDFEVTVIPLKEVEVVKDNGNAVESSHILRKATELYKEGQFDKALRLAEKCKLLDPKNPDVLNTYGEILEKTDIISAEHHYALALVIYPGHLRAIENKRRCSPRVKSADMAMLQRIEQKRDILMEIPEGNAAMTRAKLEAYYKHIYHSNGIEGNTLTLSMTRSIVETGVAVGGKSIIEHNDVLGMDAALKYINKTLLNVDGPINLDHILQIHKRVLGYTHPLDAGLYRQEQVFVGDHKPPGPLEMVKYMDSFQRWLSSRDVELLHPIELASLAHYKLVYIHPFVDGNGRTSRLLMNAFLMRAGFPPVIIKKEQRFEYYEMLQTANQGDVRPFIRFVARCTEATLDDYLSLVTLRRIETHKGTHGQGESTDLAECFDPFKHVDSLTQEKTQTNSNPKCRKVRERT